MKKLLLFVTMAASLLFTQCKKEESVSSAGKTVRMTVTAGPGSKTDITDAGAIKWSTGDKLYVGDGTQYIGYLTLVGEGGSATGVFTGNVTLTYEAEVDYEETEVEEEELGKGDGQTFHFFYLGSAKDYSGELSKGTSTSVDVEFDDQTGLLGDLGSCHVGYGSATGTVVGNVVTDINVTMLSKVAIARFDFKKGTDAYIGALTLSGDNICDKMQVFFNKAGFYCEGPKGDISLTNTTTSEKYVMLVPTSETTGEQALTFAGDNVSGSYTLANGIEANKFYGLTGAIAVTLEAPVSAGRFTVGVEEDGTTPITVEFSKGNLYYDGTASSWKFEANQWDFRTYNGKGSCINGTYNKDNGTPTNDWGLFGWSTYASNNNWGMHTKTTPTSGYTDGNFKDWGGLAIGNDPVNTWRTLSKDEWDYLLNTRTDASSLREWVTLTDVGVSGLVILPDKSTTTASSVTTKDAIASSGAVFLPAAGYRDGTSVADVGSDGVYWSSTPGEDYEVYAFLMFFNSGNVGTGYDNRDNGFAVRLVR